MCGGERALAATRDSRPNAAHRDPSVSARNARLFSRRVWGAALPRGCRKLTLAPRRCVRALPCCPAGSAAREAPLTLRSRPSSLLLFARCPCCCSAGPQKTWASLTDEGRASKLSCWCCCRGEARRFDCSSTPSARIRVWPGNSPTLRLARAHLPRCSPGATLPPPPIVDRRRGSGDAARASSAEERSSSSRGSVRHC